MADRKITLVRGIPGRDRIADPEVRRCVDGVVENLEHLWETLGAFPEGYADLQLMYWSHPYGTYRLAKPPGAAGQVPMAISDSEIEWREIKAENIGDGARVALMSQAGIIYLRTIEGGNGIDVDETAGTVRVSTLIDNSITDSKLPADAYNLFYGYDSRRYAIFRTIEDDYGIAISYDTETDAAGEPQVTLKIGASLSEGANITLDNMTDGSIRISAVSGAGDGDEKVKVSFNDTTADYLEEKLDGTDGGTFDAAYHGALINWHTLNDGGDETLQFYLPFDDIVGWDEVPAEGDDTTLFLAKHAGIIQFVNLDAIPAVDELVAVSAADTPGYLEDQMNDLTTDAYVEATDGAAVQAVTVAPGGDEKIQFYLPFNLISGWDGGEVQDFINDAGTVKWSNHSARDIYVAVAAGDTPGYLYALFTNQDSKPLTDYINVYADKAGAVPGETVDLFIKEEDIPDELVACSNGDTPGYLYDKLADDGTWIDIDIIGDPADEQVRIEHLTPDNPGSYNTVGSTSEGAEDADLGEAQAGDSGKGIWAYLVSRVGYFEGGTQTLYMYTRKIVIDACGHVHSVGPETREPVDVPEACT